MPSLGGWTINEVTYLSDGVPIAAPVVGRRSPTSISAPTWFAIPAGARRIRPRCGSIPTASPPRPVQFVAGTAPAYLDNVRTMGAAGTRSLSFKSFTIGKEKEPSFGSLFLQRHQQGAVLGAECEFAASGYVNFGQILSDSTPRVSSSSDRSSLHLLS
jgi:hypothetical protein